MLEQLVQLRQLLTERFDEGELRTLCFDLGVDYASLPAEGKANKARELVAYLDRHDHVSDLLQVGQRLRPDVDWAQVYLDDRMADLRAKRNQADQIRRERRERQRVINLRPLDVTETFRDRLREIQELCKYLSQSSVRLVSVGGRGGMGKTALVSRVLADLERGILLVPGEDRQLVVDGILYLSARSTGLSLERIYTGVGRMLGEPIASQLAMRWASTDMPLVAKVEYLLETMRDGLYIILLDNMEDALNEDGSIAEEGLHLFVECCLTQPGGIRVITTSREEVRLAAAALHGARYIPLREGLPEDEAIALLRDLDPQGTLGLRDAPEDDLRRAAHCTQGIPRALEILAGLLCEDPTANLSRLLSDGSLFGEQVVEKLVASGYHCLGENERRVMEAMAVFDQPVEETAIAYLLHPWCPDLDVRTSLHHLVNGYFVSANRTTGEYNLHPLDRQYAYHHLLDGDDTHAYGRRNLELRAANFYESIRKPQSEWQTMTDLAPQLAEIEHSIRAENYDRASYVLNSIDSGYLYIWGYYDQLVTMRERLLQLTDPSLQIANLESLGYAYYVLGRFEEAVKCYKVAFATARESHELRKEGAVLSKLGRVYRALGQIEQSVESHVMALNIARVTRNRHGESTELSHLGSAYRDLGKIEQAIDVYELALSIARQLGDRSEEGMHIGRLGLAYHYLGQFERAVEFHEMGLAIFREIGERRQQSIQFGHLALTYSILRRCEQAIDYYNQSLTLAHEIGHRREEGRSLLGLSRVLLSMGSVEKARSNCIEALMLNLPDINYQAALTLGTISLYQPSSRSPSIFEAAIHQSETILNGARGLYRPHYVLAAALVGQAISDLRWATASESERVDLLALALTEYRRALAIASAPGIVADARSDLELIRVAGIEGLEPAFELLESAAA
jgi:tetratricopeptide (TPR) repeat protein